MVKDPCISALANRKSLAGVSCLLFFSFLFFFVFG